MAAYGARERYTKQNEGGKENRKGKMNEEMMQKTIQ
jgi:hypothetical protein